MSSPALNAVFEHVERSADHYVAKLREAVAIPSVSGDPAMRKHVFSMADWLEAEMQRLHIETTRRMPGNQTLCGVTLELPPIILGKYSPASASSAKPTVLVYGHYDVQPASKSDGWSCEPWALTESDDGRLVGRGSTDDKGPVLAWLWALEAYQKTGTEFPVNILFCFEGMEESGSEGLDQVIHAEASGFFAKADCVCISDNYWMGTVKPCLTYGLRGIAYFEIVIQGPAWDLHSGVFGGILYEPMTDLVHLLASLVNTDGKILVPGIYGAVDPVTEAEKKSYGSIEFTLHDAKHAMGSDTLLSDDATQVLMNRWRFPSLSIHGIEGAFSAPGAKTVIPAKVSGKFSIRLVPSQTLDDVNSMVNQHLINAFKKLGSRNKMEVLPCHGGLPWVADHNHWNYEAAKRATKTVYGVDPDYTREGGSIPVTLTFQEALGKNVLLLPMGRADDGAHSINEKLDRKNYICGIKLMAAYLAEIGIGRV